MNDVLELENGYFYGHNKITTYSIKSALKRKNRNNNIHSRKNPKYLVAVFYVQIYPSY